LSAIKLGRASTNSNDNLVRRLESLGAEVIVSNLSEWFFYVNRSVLLKNRIQHKWGSTLGVWCWDRAAKYDAHRLERTIKGNGDFSKGPTIEEIWKNAEDYFLPWFGEASLGLGSAIYHINRGVKGIVNVMPFMCLNGMIGKTQLKRFQDDHPEIAVLNLEFDGQGKAFLEDELESFMEQVKSQDTHARLR